MLVACTTSSDYDLTSTGAVMRALYGTTSTGNFASTAEIDRLSCDIRRASDWAVRVVGRPLLAQIYAETVAADLGGPELMLSRRPVRGILRLFDSSSTADATEYCSTDYHLEDREAGILRRDAGWGWSALSYAAATPFSAGLSPAVLPGRLARPYYIEYQAGYAPLAGMDCTGTAWATQATSTAPELPGDIERAVILKTMEMWLGGDANVLSEKVGNLSVTYDRSRRSEAERLLMAYRSV